MSKGSEYKKNYNTLFDEMIDKKENEGTELNQSKLSYSNSIGMSIEELQALFAKENETIVSKDDPLLLIVTILNAFIQKNKIIQDSYLETVNKIHKEQINDFSNELEAKLETLLQSLQNIKLSQEKTQDLSQFRTTLLITTAIIALSALINVAIYILK